MSSLTDSRTILIQLQEVLAGGEHLTPHELCARLPHLQRQSILSVVGVSANHGGPIAREDVPCGVGHFGPFFRCYLRATVGAIQ